MWRDFGKNLSEPSFSFANVHTAGFFPPLCSIQSRTTMRAFLPLIAFAVFVLAAYSPTEVNSETSAMLADTTWSWPETSQNLQILQTDTGPSELRQSMMEFVFGLGVRCQHCHVGSEEMSLAEFDFVSDENPNKNIAREMMLLATATNDGLSAIDGLGDAEGPRVTCYTCHRGSTTPETVAPMPQRPPPSWDEDGN